MNGEKTTLSSLRNIEWTIVKTETNKINQVLPYISAINITELNELIYTGAELVSEKKARRKNQNEEGKFDWKRR